MMLTATSFVCFLLALSVGSDASRWGHRHVDSPPVKHVGSIAFTKPSFLRTIDSPQNSGQKDLLISSFKALGSDAVYYSPDIGSFLETRDSKRVVVNQLGDSVSWPNEVTEIDGKLYVAGGFLVPGKRGHLSVMHLDDTLANSTKASDYGSWRELIDGGKDFFHRVQSINILNKAASGNDDGHRLVTCRGRKGLVGSGGGEMVYLAKTEDTKLDSGHLVFADGPESTSVALGQIMKGCDVFFAPIDLNKDGIMEFIVPAFFTEKLLLVWTVNPSGDYRDASSVRSRIIDEDLGAAFDVEVADLLGDGSDSLLVTNHQNGKRGTPPSVFGYEIQKPDEDSVTSLDDYMESVKFVRHSLASKFPVAGGFKAAAPGGARAVHPSVKNDVAAERPVIVVSGDGANRAYMLTPLKDASNKWEYKQEVLHDCRGTVGAIEVADVNGDGWQEIFIPCYDSGSIEVYTFNPQE
jgi:hypothetical protein